MEIQVEKATIGHQQLHSCKLQTGRSGSSQGRVTGSWAVPSGQYGLPDKSTGPAVLSTALQLQTMGSRRDTAYTDPAKAYS